MRRQDIRNIAIIAHVDHGKTTPVDCLRRQSGQSRASQLGGGGSGHETLHCPDHCASGRAGSATHDAAVKTADITPLLDMVLEHVPGPEVNPDAPLQMMVTTLAWSDYVGRIATGRITSGNIRKAQKIVLLKGDGSQVNGEAVAGEDFYT